MEVGSRMQAEAWRPRQVWSWRCCAKSWCRETLHGYFNCLPVTGVLVWLSMNCLTVDHPSNLKGWKLKWWKKQKQQEYSQIFRWRRKWELLAWCPHQTARQCGGRKATCHGLLAGLAGTFPGPGSLLFWGLYTTWSLSQSNPHGMDFIRIISRAYF